MVEREKVFIGAAWPYANGQLHLGHIAGCLLPADIFARYCRLRGYDTLFVSGSDMHGTPIMVSAEKEGIPPEELAMRNHKSILKTIGSLDISYDNYTSTHTENHFQVVQDIFSTLMDKGYVDRRTQEAPFCPSCDRFMPDRYLEGECPHCGQDGARGDQCEKCNQVLDPKELIAPKCKICGDTPAFRETEHFYLLLSKLEPEIRGFVDANRDRWRPNTRNNTDNFLRDGLRDRPITRDLTWGVPIPLDGFEDKRIYVWFEAVCGYLSASREHFMRRDESDEWERFWKDPGCKQYYFLAKDNIPFHTIMWPAILLGYGGMGLPYDIPSNEFLNWDGAQFSKSKGHGATVDDILAEYPIDALRFYLSVNMPERSDSNFDLNEFIQKNNTELLGALGNYLHRVVMFIASNYGEVPERGELDPEDAAMLEMADSTYRRALDAMELVRLKEGIREMISLVNEANRYFNSRAPWKLIKEDRKGCGTVLAVALQVAKTIVYGFYPYIPHAASRWCSMLSIPTPGETTWTDGMKPIPEGTKVERPGPLFGKLELVEESVEDDMQEEEKMSEKEEDGGIITFDEFMRTDLRIGRILEVEDHPNADRLLVIKADLGEPEPRQLIAGLKDHYTKEEMVGKSIVVVANLKPAKMRGLESRGMLLAAEDGDRVTLLTPLEEIKPGSKIH